MSGKHSALRSLLREPLLHFVLIGAGLFLLFHWQGGPASQRGGAPGPQSAKIVVTRGDIEQVTGAFAKTWQRPPTEEEKKSLVESLVRDEIYYREAVATGLDRDDALIKRRLRQKMEFIFEDIAAQGDPTEADLQAFLEKHPDRYLVDPQLSFRQVYVRSDKWRTEAEAHARRVLAQFNAGADPDAAGDPFPLGSQVPLSPLWDIGRQFGEPFAKALLDLKPGRWEGPVKSGYGLHLVRIDQRIEGRQPDLKEVRDIVKRDWAVERQKELKDAAYARLRERYTVEVEGPQAASASALAETRPGNASP